MGERLEVDTFGEYILWALQGDDEECTRLACGIISDISAALAGNVAKYLSSFMPHLL